MLWNGTHIKAADRWAICDALRGISNGTDARYFFHRYASAYGTAQAESDIGYVTGDIGHEQGRKIQQWTGIPHPYLGFFREEPFTPEELLRAGQEATKAMMSKDKDIKVINAVDRRNRELREFEQSLRDGSAWE